MSPNWQNLNPWEDVFINQSKTLSNLNNKRGIIWQWEDTQFIHVQWGLCVDHYQNQEIKEEGN